MGISGLFVAVQLKADILLVAALLGTQAAGLYAAVAQLPEYLLYIPVIFTTPVLPVLSSHAAANGTREFQRLYQATFDTVMALVIPLAVVGVLIPGPSVTWLFGPSYAPAAAVLPILVSSVVFMWFSHATAIATVAARLQHHFIWIQFVCVALFMALNVALIPVWGTTGAASARLAAAALAPALTYAVLRRRTGARLSMRLLARSSMAALAMGATVVILSGQALVIVVALGLTSYVVSLWAVGGNPFASLLQKEIST
jgi:O-antigen/teichoic acid export membrane protein